MIVVSALAAVVLAALALVRPTEPRAPALQPADVTWGGGFETRDLNQWSAIETGGRRDAIKIVRTPVRSGRYAAKFTVRPSDRFGGSTGERALVCNYESDEPGQEAWWAWSTMFPRQFRPTLGGWNTFTTWHHSGTTGQANLNFQVNPDVRPATLKLEANSGRDPERPRQREFTLAKFVRNHWYDFVLHVKWSANREVAFIELWVDGRRVIRKTRLATLYPGQDTYPCQGYYRNPAPLTAYVYHGATRRDRRFP